MTDINIYAIYIDDESFQLMATGTSIESAFKSLKEDIQNCIGSEPLFVTTPFVQVDNIHRPDLEAMVLEALEDKFPDSFNIGGEINR